jgi:hypothetical protein
VDVAAQLEQETGVNPVSPASRAQTDWARNNPLLRTVGQGALDYAGNLGESIEQVDRALIRPPQGQMQLIGGPSPTDLALEDVQRTRAGQPLPERPGGFETALNAYNLAPNEQLGNASYAMAHRAALDAGLPEGVAVSVGVAAAMASGAPKKALGEAWEGARPMLAAAGEDYIARAAAAGVDPSLGLRPGRQVLTDADRVAQGRPGLSPRGNARDAAAERRNAVAARQRHLAALEAQAGGAQVTEGALGEALPEAAPALEGAGTTPSRVLLPSEREALRRAIASGREPPPEVVRAVETAAGRHPDEASRAVADVLEEALTAPAADDAVRASRLGQAVEVFNNYTLAGPLSLFFNFTGGLAQTGLNVVEAVGAAGPRGGLRYARGALGAARPALREAGQTFLEGTARAGTPLGAGQELAIRGGLSEGRQGRRIAATWATRGNAATDRAIWAVNEAGGRALGEGLGYTAQRLDDFAKRYAEEATYAGQPSKLGELFTAQRAKLSDPNATLNEKVWAAFVQSVAPFIRVPERILRQGLDLTTGGAIHAPELRSADPAIRRQAQGRMVAGASTTLAIGLQALNGAITGDGPDDPDQRAALEAQRNAAGDPLWRRNSAKIEIPFAGPGGTSRVLWLPNRAFGAVGVQMDTVANALEDTRRELRRAGSDPLSVAGTVLAAPINSAVSTAVGDAWFDDLTRFADRSRKGQFLPALAEQAAGVASRPLAAVAPLARATDPYVRDVERGDVLGRAMERVPGLRQALPVRTDPTTGQALEVEGGPVERFLGATTPRATDVRAETTRLYALRDAEGKARYPGVLPRTFDEREVTYAGTRQSEAQKRVLQEAYGEAVATALRPLVADPRYRQAGDAQKAQLVRTALAAAYKRADLEVGDRVARDPQARFELEWARTPQYRGVEGTPERIARQNLEITEAKQLLDAYQRRDGETPGRYRFYEEHPDLIDFARRPEVPERALAEEKARLRRRFGLPTPAEEAGASLLGAGGSPQSGQGALAGASASFVAPEAQPQRQQQRAQEQFDIQREIEGLIARTRARSSAPTGGGGGFRFTAP